MKGLSLHPRGIIFIVCSIVLFIGVHKLQHSFFSVENIVFAIDPYIANQEQEKIETFVHQTKKETQTLSVFAQKIQAAFPYIKHVTLERVPPRCLYVELAIHRPLCVINQGGVFLNNGAVVDRGMLSAYFMDGIPEITYNAEASFPQFKKMIKQIPYTAFSDYHVSWNTENEIILQDKNQKEFSLVCNIDQPPTQNILAHCSQIKQNLIERNAFSHKKTASWVADLRFNKQIVLYKNPGG